MSGRFPSNNFRLVTRPAGRRGLDVSHSSAVLTHTVGQSVALSSGPTTSIQGRVI
jgi:hypothetical protein